MPLLFAVALTLTIVSPAAGQGGGLNQAQGDPKALFTSALGQFSAALDGKYGDEAGRIRASLTAMDQALAQWDDMIRGYEAAMTAELSRTEPGLAARLHLAMSATLLDRGRVDAALVHVAGALRLDATRADAYVWLGLVQNQLKANPAAAGDALQKASALAPADPLRAYLLARHLASTGRLDEAARAGAGIIAGASATAPDARAQLTAPFVRLGLVPEVPGIEPFFPPVRYAPGFAFLTRGQYEQAVASFKEASAADPLAVGTAGVVTLIDRAAAALRDGDPATAVGALEEAVRASPGRGDTHRLLGLAHLADGRIEPGLASMREAIRLAPRDERARLALADTLMQQARYVEAERALREALETLPDAGRTRYTLGLSYQRQGLYPDAVRELDASLAFAPLLGLNSVYDTIATLRRAQQDFEGATLAFARRADLVPNSASAHRDLGDIYFRQGLDDLAWLEFLVAEMLDPRDVTTQAALAQLHLRAGRHEAAVIASKRTLALDDTHKQAHYVLATALIRLGRMEEGAPALLVFNRLQAEEAQARSQQLELGGLTREAALSTARQEHARAVELLTRALALAPRSPEAHIDLGVALLQAGRAPDAVERLQAAAGLGAPSEVYRHLADAYAALGQQAESQRARDAYARIRRDELRQAGAR